MIKSVEDAFTIIHIRISSVKILGFSSRHFITGFLIVFVIFNTLRLFSTIYTQDYWAFFEASIFIVLTLYFCLMWIVAWPKAGRLLNQAGEYEEEHNKKK